MYNYLEQIKTPSDLKNLDYKQLDALCGEIREYLVNTVASRGGHLASNLGAVELTVALHRVLNAPTDKIVWDVGHQAYVHKIITGRMQSMDTLRTWGGLSGFCNPEESEYDTCYTGHASTSLSTALGMAQARKINGEKYNIAAVIGDGSFTGGLAFEALNNIGMLRTKMLIILNDNEMSIAENVGAFSGFLSRARTNPKYTASKRKIVDALHRRGAAGAAVFKALHKMKRHIKSMVTPNMFFEQYGVTYLGPVDGHNIKDMEDILSRAAALDEPVLVHVLTKKGKGYRPAERSPQIYHGVSPFEKNQGIVVKKVQDSYSHVFGDELCRIACENKKVVAITPAMIPGSGLSLFAKHFPDRLYDVGIAEGHAVTFGAGLAIGGAVPVVAIYSTFLQRGVDNVIHDVALGKNHVVLAIDRAGIVAGDGATHQGLFDITYLTAVPNITLLSPSSYSELRKMLYYAVNVHNGPVAIRYPRGNEAVNIDNGEFVLSKAAVLKKGTDITLVAEGQSVANAFKAAQILEEKGISAEVIDVRTVKPLDYETVVESVQKCGKIITIEENMRRGGMGEMIASEIAMRGINAKIHIHSVDDVFVPHGSIKELNNKFGFTAEAISDTAERMLKS